MAKHKKTDFAPHLPPNQARACEADGCMQEGMYKAPKSRGDVHSYQFLCLDHVREYNKKWDFFKGMESDEIEAFMKDAVTGHRVTWKRETDLKNPGEKLQAALDEFLNIGRHKAKPKPRLPAKINKALTVMELEYPYTLPQLKNQYKQLVKRYHPDHHQGDKQIEEKFKLITTAYKTLSEHIE